MAAESMGWQIPAGAAGHGAPAVLLKGGHLAGDVVSDLLVTQNGEVHWMRAPRTLNHSYAPQAIQLKPFKAVAANPAGPGQ